MRDCRNTTMRILGRPRHRRKIALLDACWYGRRRAYLGWQKSLEKELEKLQRKLNGPQKTAKHIEAKQNWINRESKRFESESSKLAEWQESLRVRKETLRVAFEEINILWGDLLGEGESMDKKQEPLHVSGRTRKKFESPSNKKWLSGGDRLQKKIAGWTRGGSSEEIAGWMLEAQRLNREVEAKKRKLQETIEKESKKDARMGDDSICRREGANTDIASNIRVETAC